MVGSFSALLVIIAAVSVVAAPPGPSGSSPRDMKHAVTQSLRANSSKVDERNSACQVGVAWIQVESGMW